MARQSLVYSNGRRGSIGATAMVALLALSLLPVLALAAEEQAEEKHVLTLTEANFDEHVTDDKTLLVEFFAPWCEHCKRLAPEYEAAAKKVKEKNMDVVLAAVDATTDSALADKYGVRGYPTIFFVKNKTAKEYSGGRTADGIVSWIEKMTGPPATEIDGNPEDHITEENKVIFVATVKSRDSPMKKMFEKMADEARQLGQFLIKVVVDAEERIHVHRHEEGFTVYDGSSEDDLRSFFKNESFPLFGKITGMNFKDYVEREQDLVWMCGSPTSFGELKTEVREAAKNYRKEYSFVWLNSDEFRGHCENALGVSEFPALVYQSKSGRFVLPNPVESLKDHKSIVKFFEDVTSGKIERSIKSEPVPEENDGPVRVVVGSNFDSEVFQKDKHVFIEIYAPWCGLCTKLAPTWQELGEKMQNRKNLVIAKMDGTQNEVVHQELEWTGFPTLFLLKANTTTPVKYEGPRTIEKFVEFLDKHAPEEEVADKGEEL